MIVFKDYFKILKAFKGPIIMYVAILLVFTAFSTTSGSTTKEFQASKPNIIIIIEDSSALVDNLIDYIGNNADITEKNDNVSLDDMMFYREANCILYIYDGYTKDYLNNQEKELDVQYTTDYNASYMKMILDRYFKIADLANDYTTDEQLIIDNINKAVDNKVSIKIDNTLDTDSVSSAEYFFNFSNYSVLALCIYIVALMMSVFNNQNIKRRNIISKKGITSISKNLYLANLVFALFVWIFVIVLGIILFGEVMFTINGILFILNSLIFTITALSLGFLVGNICQNKDAINGIVNVVALGSSFLCGCFIPTTWLPDSVIAIAKFLPSYYYIHNNGVIKSMESLNSEVIKELLINSGIVLAFGIAFVVITFIYQRRKRSV